MPKARFRVFSPTAAGVAQAYANYPRSAGVMVKEVYKEEGAVLVGIMTRRSTRFPLKKRSGNLGRKWFFEVVGQSLTARMAVWNFQGYSKVHEFGELVTARGRGFLFIPTDLNRKPNGKPKVSPTKARRRIDAGQWRYSSTPVGSGRGGSKKIFIFNELDLPMFTLVKSAKYKAVLRFFEQSAEARDRTVRRLADGSVDVWLAKVPAKKRVPTTFPEI